MEAGVRKPLTSTGKRWSKARVWLEKEESGYGKEGLRLRGLRTFFCSAVLVREKLHNELILSLVCRGSPGIRDWERAYLE